MSLTIRPYTKDDAKVFADIHYASVHTIGVNHYIQEILDEWSPTVNEERIEHIEAFASKEIRVMADYDKKTVGLGVVVPEKSLLGACYVHPDFSGKGIGKAIMNELEKIANSHSINYLEMDASINSKNFYERCGYQTVIKSTYTLKSGLQMDCYKMKKELRVR